MTEPVIVCPKCKTEIKLTESLSAPLIESARREYEQRLAQKDADIAKREEAFSKAKETLDNQFAGKLREERAKIAVEEARNDRNQQRVHQRIRLAGLRLQPAENPVSVAIDGHALRAWVDIPPNIPPAWRDASHVHSMKTIKDMPEHSRPREKLREKGVSALTDLVDANRRLAEMWGEEERANA